MNYRHAFHAGNFADVMKHIAIATVIEHLKRKDKPFCVIDTHAGAGLYDLCAEEAVRGAEWADGIGRLSHASSAPNGFSPAVREAMAPYLSAVSACDALAGEPETTASPKCYPGSPWLAAHLLRPQDRLVANEPEVGAHTALRTALKPFSNAKATKGDGWQLLSSVLPPPERRGLILVDPPFEQTGELERLVTSLATVTTRFETGIALLWYPIKDRRAINRFHKDIAKAARRETLACELLIQSERVINRLNGCGLIVMNPPFGFAESIADVLNSLARVLGRDTHANGRVIVLANPDQAGADRGDGPDKRARSPHRAVPSNRGRPQAR